jgi:TPR repeat protein
MKIKHNIFIAVFILMILFSCHKEKSTYTKSLNTQDRSDDVLKDLALNHGDTVAYEDLSISYLDLPSGLFLPIAEEMANKYKYPQAYYDVYFELSFDSCNEKSMAKAIKYLKLAFDKGHFQALYTLGNMYYEGKYLPKDTILGQKLLMKYDSIWIEMSNTDL